ncbi:MAG TPA: hypothetical protein VKF41_06315 [Bryobacteraceae bacterium]|nr:hypothetical protein [Bryobacteraceae bacterium]
MQMSCRERDRIILALALAVNDANNGYAILEWASDDDERRQALQTIETSQDHCNRLRRLVVSHCQSHGC